MKPNLEYYLGQRKTQVLILISIVIVPRIILILNAPNVYHFDPYMYLREAIAFASTGSLDFQVGLPFVFSLGLVVIVFGPIFGTILAARLYSVALSVLLVLTVYLLASKISGTKYALATSVLAAFEPYFLMYSVVPHNDVFAITMGLVAFYLAASPNTVSSLISPVFLYLSAFTRPELFFAFGIPMMILFVWRCFRSRTSKSFILLLFIAVTLAIPLVVISSISSIYSRFDVIEKFALFLRVDTLATVMVYTFGFYGSTILDIAFFLLVVLGTAMLFIYPLIEQSGCKQEFRESNRNITLNAKTAIGNIIGSERAMITFCLLSVFILEVIALAVYGFSYAIVDSKLVILPWLPDRYVILLRIMTSFPLAYLITLVARRVNHKIGGEE